MDENQRITEINDCLSVATKRQTGLIKLSNCLEKCSSSQLIDDNGTFWLRQLLQILDNYPVTMHAKLSHYCLYLLIQQSKCSNELSKLISSSCIDKILNTLISSSEPLTKNSLVCIFELMNCYRGPCTSFKQKIENYVLSKLDSNSEEIVEWASKCYGFLPNIYRAVNNNDIWYTYFSNALFNANQILIEIFGNLIDENNLQIQQTTATINLFKTSLTKDQTNNRHYYEKLSKRFSACLKCLNSLLTCCSEHIAKVRINEIILFLKHLYQLDLKSMLNNRLIATKPEFKPVVEILNQIYKSIMQFSQTFFQTLSTNLLPYSDVINKMIAQFSTTSTEDIFIDTLSVYYDTITTYMQSLGTNCAFSKLCSCVVDNILDYVKPIRSKLIIDLKKESKERLDKKFLTEFMMKQNNNNNKRSNNVNQRDNASIIFKYDCVALTKSCLKCLNNLIHYFSSQINDAEYNKIQKAIIDLVINVQHNYINKEPYSEDECRLELYKCLYELCIATNNASEPPFAIAINLFDNGKSDSSFQIKTYLETVLLSLRAYTDPKIPVTYRYQEYQFDNSLVKRQQQQQQQQQVQPHSIFDNRMSLTTSFNNINNNNNSRQYMNDNNIQLNNNSANNYDIASNSQSNSFKFSMAGSLNENSKQGEGTTSQLLPPASVLIPQSSYQTQLQQEPQTLINEQPSTSVTSIMGHRIQNNYENIVNNNHGNRNELNRQTRKRQLSEDEEIVGDDEEVNKKNVYSRYTIEEEVIDDDDDDDDDDDEEDDEEGEDEDDEDIDDEEDDDEEVEDDQEAEQMTSKINKQIQSFIQKRALNQAENAKRSKIDNGDEDDDDDDDELMEQDDDDYIDEDDQNYPENEHENENEKINLSKKSKDNGDEILIDDEDEDEESDNSSDNDDDGSKEKFRNLNGNNVANVNDNAEKNGNEGKVNGETNNEATNNAEKQTIQVTISATETAPIPTVAETQSENQLKNELIEKKTNESSNNNNNNNNNNQNDTTVNDNHKLEDQQTVEIQTTITTTSINAAINGDTNTVITEIKINQLETKKAENLIETLKENNKIVNNTENNDNELKEMLNAFRPDAEPTENR